MTAAQREFLDATLPHLGMLQNLAQRLARDPGSIEDLVQETYLRAFAGWDGFKGGSVRSWLASICLNTFRSDIRRRLRRPRETPTSDVGVEMADRQDVSDEAINAAAWRDALAVIDQLPAAKRLTLILVDVAGLTAQEAAEVLGCPRGTVLARVHRARREVASALENHRVLP